MTLPSLRIFLDTNVYILGLSDEESLEARILEWAGMGENGAEGIEIVVSSELFREIRRVGKRLFDKDWVGLSLAFIWRQLNPHYVVIDDEELRSVIETGLIPREDAAVYLTARVGQAQCFVSANHKLIRALVEYTGDFECFTPVEFAEKYLF